MLSDEVSTVFAKSNVAATPETRKVNHCKFTTANGLRFVEDSKRLIYGNQDARNFAATKVTFIPTRTVIFCP